MILLSTSPAAVLLGRGGGAGAPTSPPRRRVVIAEAARLAAAATSVVGAAALLAGGGSGGGTDRAELALYSDDPATARQLAQLRSSNQLAPSRRALEADWAELRGRAVSRAEAERAFATVLQARAAVVRAEDAARHSRWAELDAAVPLALVRELEMAATVLARAPFISAEGRADIGWQWGACGFRRCGAQADAAQALCKLRANLGMVVPMEALFYLDVAKRAIDEVVSVGAGAGLGAGAALPRRAPDEYMQPETLDTILVDELLGPLDAATYARRGAEGGSGGSGGGSDEVEAALAEYEARMLAELERQLARGADEPPDDDE